MIRYSGLQPLCFSTFSVLSNVSKYNSFKIVQCAFLYTILNYKNSPKENKKMYEHFFCSATFETSSNYITSFNHLSKAINPLILIPYTMAVQSSTIMTGQNFKKQIIIDCDAGGDDAMAILLLLAGEANKEIDILAITCVSGNAGVHHVKVNVLRTLQAVNRLDIPVYVGADGPLITPYSELNSYYGNDGFGEAYFANTPDVSIVKEQNAVEFLNKIAIEKKGEISLVCLGPLTNIALALRTYSEFAKNIKDIYIMGGNHRGVGNATSAAEYNFFFDPEAAQIVLSTIQCPIILIPWEASVETALPLEWRFEVLGKLTTPQVELLNTMEKSLQSKKKKKPKFWAASDSVVSAVLLRPSIATKSHTCHMTVELHGHATRGQSILDHLQKNEHNTTVIESVNREMFKELLLWAAGMEKF